MVRNLPSIKSSTSGKRLRWKPEVKVTAILLWFTANKAICFLREAQTSPGTTSVGGLLKGGTPNDYFVSFGMVRLVVSLRGWCILDSVEVCDGSCWKLKIRHSGNKLQKLNGTVEYPPHGKHIECELIQLCEEAGIFEPYLFGCSGIALHDAREFVDKWLKKGLRKRNPPGSYWRINSLYNGNGTRGWHLGCRNVSPIYASMKKKWNDKTPYAISLWSHMGFMLKLFFLTMKLFSHNETNLGHNEIILLRKVSLWISAGRQGGKTPLKSIKTSAR